MDIVITGRHIEVPERFRRLAEEKLAKISQLAPKAQRADVELSHERNPRQEKTCERVEITVRGKGPVIRAEASAEDPAAALDIAFGKLLERVRRTRDRRKVHHGRHTPASLRLAPVSTEPRGSNGASSKGVPPVALDGPAALNGRGHTVDVLDAAAETDAPAHERTAAGLESDGSPVVIRVKDHDAHPMTLDQALYEMELVGHDFYLYVDSETQCPCVVYRRRGWNYGVIRLQVSQDAESLMVPAPAT